MHLFSIPEMRYAGRYQQTGMTLNDIYRLNKIYNHLKKEAGLPNLNFT